MAAADVTIANRALTMLGQGEQQLLTLTDFSGGDRASKYLNKVYDAIRDEVLGEHAWNVLTRRVLLDEAFDEISISAISWSSDVVTVDTASNHGLSVDQTVEISDVSPIVYNGRYRVASVTDADTFTYELEQSSDPGAGTVTDATMKRVPAFGLERFFSLPSDFVRLHKVRDLDTRYRIETDESLIAADASAGEFGIIYIASISDVSVLPPHIATVLVTAVARELSVALGRSDMRPRLEELYFKHLDEARYKDALEAPVEVIQGSSWLNAHRRGHGDSVASGDARAWLDDVV